MPAFLLLYVILATRIPQRECSHSIMHTYSALLDPIMQLVFAGGLPRGGILDRPA